jgi:hypothetical protein
MISDRIVRGFDLVLSIASYDLQIMIQAHMTAKPRCEFNRC